MAGVRIGIQGAAPSFHRGVGGVNRTETEFSSRCGVGVRLDTNKKIPLEKESFQKEGSKEGMKKRNKREGREETSRVGRRGR